MMEKETDMKHLADVAHYTTLTAIKQEEVDHKCRDEIVFFLEELNKSGVSFEYDWRRNHIILMNEVSDKFIIRLSSIELDQNNEKKWKIAYIYAIFEIANYKFYRCEFAIQTNIYNLIAIFLEFLKYGELPNNDKELRIFGC